MVRGIRTKFHLNQDSEIAALNFHIKESRIQELVKFNFGQDSMITTKKVRGPRTEAKGEILLEKSV